MIMTNDQFQTVDRLFKEKLTEIYMNFNDYNNVTKYIPNQKHRLNISPKSEIPNECRIGRINKKTHTPYLIAH